MAHQQAFFLVSGIIFGLVALFHALRLVLRWRVDLRSQEIPMWLSGVGFSRRCRDVLLGVLAPSVMARSP